MQKKDGILYVLANFTGSDKKEIIIEHKGPKLNSVFQIMSDLWHFKYPLKYFPKVLKIIIQIPVFRISRHIVGGRLKNSIYRLFGAKIGKDVLIAFDVWLDEFLPELITIEDGTIIGEHSKIFTHEALVNRIKFGKVHIGKQAVVGLNSVVRCGTDIGEGSIVAMNSLVNKDVSSMTLVGGVPIHLIRKLKKIL